MDTIWAMMTIWFLQESLLFDNNGDPCIAIKIKGNKEDSICRLL